jgi:hypothetical protein
MKYFPNCGFIVELFERYITYEETYFLKNMCAVSFISKIYVSRTAVPKKWFANVGRNE